MAIVPEAAKAAADTPQVEEKKRRRRRRLLSSDQQAELIRRIAQGASLRQAAAMVGCHHTTVGRLLKEDEHFAAMVARCGQLSAFEAIRCLSMAGSKEWRAAASLLTYLDKREEKRRQRRQERRSKSAAQDAGGTA